MFIENRTFDEIEVGETATLERTLSRADIELFAVMSGDVNPAHLDEEYAHSDMFHEIIAHGMWGGVADLDAARHEAARARARSTSSRRCASAHPVTIGDTITVSVTATDKDAERHRISFDCRCVNQHGEKVIDGIAKVIAPVREGPPTARRRCRRCTCTITECCSASCSRRRRRSSRFGWRSSHPVDRDASARGGPGGAGGPDRPGPDRS